MSPDLLNTTQKVLLFLFGLEMAMKYGNGKYTLVGFLVQFFDKIAITLA